MVTGKTIVVTGVASGIGAATAHLLQERGARVIGLDRHKPDEIVETYIPIDLLRWIHRSWTIFLQTVAIRARATAPGLNTAPPPGQPDEVAEVIAFLCSNESRRLNGVNIPVDGGTLAARIAHNLSF